MRVELVSGRVLRSIANQLVELLQFSVHRHLHEQRFDKLAGLADLKHLRLDESATSNSFRNCLFGFDSIRADMDRHVRLKDGCVISSCKIDNCPFKEGARRLSRNKPIGYRSFFHFLNNTLASHAHFQQSNI
jgi:hypothetical protein